MVRNTEKATVWEWDSAVVSESHQQYPSCFCIHAFAYYTENTI